MRWLAVVLVLAGCGDSATAPAATPSIEELLPTASFDVIAGAGQADTIGARLQPIAVRLTDASARAMSGVGVSFVLVEPDCGSVFAGFAMTDTDGRAATLWDLGTNAKDCTMEARAVLPDGTPVVYASTTATVEAGQPIRGRFFEAVNGTQWRTNLGPDSISFAPDDYYLGDRADNGIAWSAAVLGGPFVARGGWLVAADTTGHGEVEIAAQGARYGTVQVGICMEGQGAGRHPELWVYPLGRTHYCM